MADTGPSSARKTYRIELEIRLFVEGKTVVAPVVRRGGGRKSLHAPLSGKWVHENPLTRQTNTEWCIRPARVHVPRHESVDRPCKRPCQVLPSRCQVWKLWAAGGPWFQETGGSGNIGDKFTAEIETSRLTRISATEIDGLLCRDARQWDFDGIVYSGRKESGK